VTFTPSKTGQVIVPISPRAISGLDAQEIATAVSPAIIEAAYAAGGAPVGAPELLREDELRARTDDPVLIETIDAHPDLLWIIADMVPADQADDVVRGRTDEPALEIVAPPVRFPRRRGR
jgi:hypothetical protein